MYEYGRSYDWTQRDARELYALAVADTEARIVEMLKREDAKCDEYLSKGHDQDKRIQQEHYSESMNWTIEAIECGDHDG